MQQVRLQEDRTEAYFRRRVLPDAHCARHKPETMKLDYKISFVLYPCKPTPRRSLYGIRAEPLELQAEMDGSLADLLPERKRVLTGKTKLLD